MRLKMLLKLQMKLKEIAMNNDKKEYLYNELNIILEYLDKGDSNSAAIQLEGLINELKYDQL